MIPQEKISSETYPPETQGETPEITSPGLSKESEQQEEPLTVEYASKLLFLSYRFSQGKTELQKKIFQYIHLLHPDWRINNDTYRKTREKVEPVIKKFILEKRGQYYIRSTESEIEASIESELQEMRFSFAGETVEDRKKIVETLALTILDRDRRYLIILPLIDPKLSGRPRENNQEKVTSAIDPYLSQLCYYGFLDHKTGTEEYDLMFQEISDYFQKSFQANLLSHDTRLNFLEVVANHNQHHLNEQIFLTGIDPTYLQGLKPYLKSSDFAKFRKDLQESMKIVEAEAIIEIKKLWELISPTLERTHDAQVVREQLWSHPDFQEERGNARVAEYIARISQFIAENPEISFDDFLRKSLVIFKPAEEIEQKLKYLDQLEKIQHLSVL